ncbi:uncharacterized protein LOC128638238 isoform X2 [Bombina bombina]|nr:uncharacterized protein LOC128638238 isoform X2 [Bombina bombina]
MEFDEVPVYYSDEEWDCLNEEQRKLYKDLTIENNQILRSLVRDFKTKGQKYDGASRWKVRERAERYTVEEKEVLIREVLAREDILWSKNPWSAERSKAWKDITAAVCRVGRLRTVSSVKHRFHDCRSEVRKKMEQAAVGKEVTFAHWEEMLRRYLLGASTADSGEQSEESQFHQEEEIQEREKPALVPKCLEESSVPSGMEGPPQPAPPLQEQRNDGLVPQAPILLQPVPATFTDETPPQSDIVRHLRLLRQEQQREIRWQMRIYAQQERTTHQLSTMTNLLQQLLRHVGQNSSAPPATYRQSFPASSSTLASVHLKYVKRRIKREASRSLHKKYKNHKHI